MHTLRCELGVAYQSTESVRPLRDAAAQVCAIPDIASGVMKKSELNERVLQRSRQRGMRHDEEVLTVILAIVELLEELLAAADGLV